MKFIPREVQKGIGPKISYGYISRTQLHVYSWVHFSRPHFSRPHCTRTFIVARNRHQRTIQQGTFSQTMGRAACNVRTDTRSMVCFRPLTVQNCKIVFKITICTVELHTSCSESRFMQVSLTLYHTPTHLKGGFKTSWRRRTEYHIDVRVPAVWQRSSPISFCHSDHCPSHPTRCNC
jgi:hypothetical protein